MQVQTRLGLPPTDTARAHYQLTRVQSETAQQKHQARHAGELPGDQQRLYDRSGNSIATYRGRTNFTYDNNGVRFGSGNRLAGLVDDRD